MRAALVGTVLCTVWAVAGCGDESSASLDGRPRSDERVLRFEDGSETKEAGPAADAAADAAPNDAAPGDTAGGAESGRADLPGDATSAGKLGDACQTHDQCAPALVCDGTPSVCRHPAGCNELKAARANTATGPAQIQCSAGAPVQVVCEMDLDGGGWTVITPTLARNAFGAAFARESGTARFSYDMSNRPFAEALDRFTGHYTFDFGCGFREFTLRDYVARAEAISGECEIFASEFVQSDWSLAADTRAEDISFGAAANSGPETSFAAQGTSVMCADCEIPWPGQGSYSVSTFSPRARFRIGWGNSAVDEAFYPWWSGEILLR